jgi:hypothetical protein
VDRTAPEPGSLHVKLTSTFCSGLMLNMERTSLRKASRPGWLGEAAQKTTM